MGDQGLKCDELLGRYLDMWKPEVEVNFAEDLAERLRKGRENAQRVLHEMNPEPKLLTETVEAEPVEEEEDTTPTRIAIAPQVEKRKGLCGEVGLALILKLAYRAF